MRTKSSRRAILVGLSAALFVAISGPESAAAAANGGNGKGGGSGNAGRNSDDSGSGNGGGNGNAVGNGNGGAGKAKETNRASSQGVTTPNAMVGAGTSSVRFRHHNGFVEELSGGRYEMTDNRGRTIINRPATRKDLDRLQHLIDNAGAK